MASIQAGELAQRFIEALHNLEKGADESGVPALVALFASDAKIVNSAMLLGGDTEQGQSGATEFWTEYKKTIGIGESHFHHIGASGDTAGLFWKTTMHGGGSYDGATLLAFGEDGLIHYFQGYYDTKQLSTALGAAK